VSSTRAFTRRVIHLSIDADAPRAVIGLAYRRNDRSPAVLLDLDYWALLPK